METRIESYLAEGFPEVEGWLDPVSARAIAALASQQAPGAALGEIGVHHGKLCIVLALCAHADETVFAVDVFGQHQLNLDRSGAGDERRFRANLSRWAGRDDPVVFRDSSLNLRADDIRARCGAARFVSIDGGHTAECTLNDLRLADALLRPDGAAVLDDFFNSNWPGVATGAAAYFAAAPEGLRPFAITPNKVFLARGPATATYRALLRACFGAHFDKHAEMFGAEVDIYSQHSQALRNAVKATPFWPAVRPLARAAWRALRR